MHVVFEPNWPFVIPYRDLPNVNLSKIEKVPRGIRCEKSSKDMASSNFFILCPAPLKNLFTQKCQIQATVRCHLCRFLHKGPFPQSHHFIPQKLGPLVSLMKRICIYAPTLPFKKGIFFVYTFLLFTLQNFTGPVRPVISKFYLPAPNLTSLGHPACAIFPRLLYNKLNILYKTPPRSFPLIIFFRIY